MTAQTEGSLLSAIQESPADPLPRLAYADWLTEQGQHALAYAYRWSAHHHRFPRQTPQGLWWHWGVARRTSRGEQFLPRPIYDYLPKAPRLAHGNYHTMRGAFAALALALRDLHRLLGLDPFRLEYP